MAEPGSKICRAAAADALLTAGILILCVLCAFAYDVNSGLGGLIAVFLVGSVPLALVATLDVLNGRHLARGRDPSLLRESAGAGSLAAALLLLLVGALFTVVEVGVGGDKSSAFASWTSTAVGYLLLAALGAQAVLLVLAWLMRRNSPAADR